MFWWFLLLHISKHTSKHTKLKNMRLCSIQCPIQKCKWVWVYIANLLHYFFIIPLCFVIAVKVYWCKSFYIRPIVHTSMESGNFASIKMVRDTIKKLGILYKNAVFGFTTFWHLTQMFSIIVRDWISFDIMVKVS